MRRQQQARRAGDYRTPGRAGGAAAAAAQHMPAYSPITAKILRRLPAPVFFDTLEAFARDFPELGHSISTAVRAYFYPAYTRNTGNLATSILTTLIQELETGRPIRGLEHKIKAANTFQCMEKTIGLMEAKIDEDEQADKAIDPRLTNLLHYLILLNSRLAKQLIKICNPETRRRIREEHDLDLGDIVVERASDEGIAYLYDTHISPKKRDAAGSRAAHRASVKREARYARGHRARYAAARRARAAKAAARAAARAEDDAAAAGPAEAERAVAPEMAAEQVQPATAAAGGESIAAIAERAALAVYGTVEQLQQQQMMPAEAPAEVAQCAAPAVLDLAHFHAAQHAAYRQWYAMQQQAIVAGWYEQPEVQPGQALDPIAYAAAYSPYASPVAAPAAAAAAAGPAMRADAPAFVFEDPAAAAAGAAQAGGSPRRRVQVQRRAAVTSDADDSAAAGPAGTGTSGSSDSGAERDTASPRAAAAAGAADPASPYSTPGGAAGRRSPKRGGASGFDRNGEKTAAPDFDGSEGEADEVATAAAARAAKAARPTTPPPPIYFDPAADGADSTKAAARRADILSLFANQAGVQQGHGAGTAAAANADGDGLTVAGVTNLPGPRG